ncbi:methyl-accepting chemotaxis protein [Denitrobaculum tricleocarpae]|uniref:HAMP domain-containing protein n=1 Tax=Denitrobaculum tricleocarpae TaxID=2591009 RepID=A0A545TT46_9PROT|nr:methyl-accepting chemotaxis protein [Denitrobaculum tricleocarpae]TQV80386.1 HAMP domain-containing protein [Denitrobaculum tricleocarpae]
MYQNSLSMRIASKIILLLIGGMAVLLFVQTYLSQSFFSGELARFYEKETLLLASQMDGGIKWKKADKINSVYEKQTLKEENSNLANALITDAEKTPLSSFTSEIYESTDLAAVLEDFEVQESATPFTTKIIDHHVITVTAIIDAKSKNTIGYVAMAWSKQSALDSMAAVRNSSLAASAVIILIIAASLIFLLKSMAIKPIRNIKDVMSRLADGHLKTEVPYVKNQDEIGQMAQALLIFKENAGEIVRMKEQEDARNAQLDAEKKSDLLRIADVLDKEVKSAVSDTNTQADSMKNSSAEMRDVIAQLGDQTSTVGKGAERASGSIQAVASATEELSASISEITRQVEQASSIAQDASKEAARTDQTVGGLSEAAQKIGDVINMIQDIAKQTNLLALNATIEAARAGEMGKGFAVVASEVKHLASQTAKATEEISTQIGAIREETDGAVGAIRSISGTIEKINEISESIAGAVQQQSNATQEISASVQDTVQHMSEVSSQVADVIGGTEQVNQHSNTVMENAEQTSTNIGRLETRMGTVLSQLRESANVDRRADDRKDGSWSAQVIDGERALDCVIANVSLGGVLLKNCTGLQEGIVVTLAIDGFGENLSGHVVSVSPQGAHLKFILEEDQREKVRSFFELSKKQAA